MRDFVVGALEFDLWSEAGGMPSVSYSVKEIVVPMWSVLFLGSSVYCGI